MDKNRFLIQLSESKSTDFGKRAFAEQSREQQVFSAIWELESLVNNGGFRGYFGNSAETAAFAPTALRAIGANQCAAIVDEALTLVPAELATASDPWSVMHSLPDAMTQKFEALDERCFVYPDDLTELLFAFVAQHPEAFGPVPTA